MREFSLYPHGAGRNFLGALQQTIRGSVSTDTIRKQISNNNLFDSQFPPVNFNPDFERRTNWNQQLLESQRVWIEHLDNRRTLASAKKIIIDNLNECYEGSFHLKLALPTISRYSIVCVVDSQAQHRWLDQLATHKKEGPTAYSEGNLLESDLCHQNNLDLMPSYRADWSFDYTGLFLELNTSIIDDFIDRTEDCFNCKSAVTQVEIVQLIQEYSRRNTEILDYE
jgi:hypothetical protein